MKHRWLWAWLLQIVEMMAVCLVQALCAGLHPVLHGLLLWGFVPIMGLFTAERAVRRGLNNYLAWLAPIGCLALTNLILWGYSPSAGAALVTALASIVGAAAGEVLNQRKSKQHQKRR